MYAIKGSSTVKSIAEKNKLIGWCNFTRKGNMDGEAYGLEQNLRKFQESLRNKETPLLRGVSIECITI